MIGLRSFYYSLRSSWVRQVSFEIGKSSNVLILINLQFACSKYRVGLVTFPHPSLIGQNQYVVLQTQFDSILGNTILPLS